VLLALSFAVNFALCESLASFLGQIGSVINLSVGTVDSTLRLDCLWDGVSTWCGRGAVLLVIWKDATHAGVAPA